MINAEKARINAAKVLEEIVKKQMDEIEERVLLACADGEFDVVYAKPIKRATVLELEKLGYIVRAEDNLTYIAWVIDLDEDSEKEEADEVVNCFIPCDAEDEKEGIMVNCDSDEQEEDAGELVPDSTEEFLSEEEDADENEEKEPEEKDAVEDETTEETGEAEKDSEDEEEKKESSDE